MNESIKDKIKRFELFNERAIRKTMEIVIDNEYVHKYVVLFSIIDSLSKSVNVKNNESRMRYIASINEYANWGDINRVSLLHVKRAIEQGNNPHELSKLENYVTNQLNKKYPKCDGLIRNDVGIDVDPDLNEISQYWPKNEKGEYLKINNCTIDKFKHGNLFYHFRNTVVHEFRHPGNIVDSKMVQIDKPVYTQLVKFNGLEKGDLMFSYQWEMVYPLAFIFNIAMEMNKNICKKFNDANLNPFENYTNGTYWIPELNKE